MKKTIALIILSASLAVAGQPNGQVEISGRFYYLQPVHHSHWVPVLKYIGQCAGYAATAYFTGKIVANRADRDFNADANQAFNQFQTQFQSQLNALSGAVRQPGQLAH